jgi:ADP-ribose pyrophosphatase YjhB (NUDIX family)
MTGHDLIGAQDQWLPQEQYDFIVAHVPILCVDLIPLSDEEQPRIGLIERATPDDVTGWCLVGGRVMRDEPLESAVRRHLHATLGDEIDVDPATLRPVGVIEYFSQEGVGEFHDPRKHAVSVTYSGRCSGIPHVQTGTEAIDFAWFTQEQLPAVRFGFGQQKVMKRFLTLSRETQRSDAVRLANGAAERTETGNKSGSDTVTKRCELTRADRRICSTHNSWSSIHESRTERPDLLACLASNLR